MSSLRSQVRSLVRQVRLRDKCPLCGLELSALPEPAGSFEDHSTPEERAELAALWAKVDAVAACRECGVSPAAAQFTVLTDAEQNRVQTIVNRWLARASGYGDRVSE